MSSVRSPTVRLAVVGNGRVEAALSELDDGAGAGVVVESVPPRAADDRLDSDRVDCVVVDGAADGVDAVATAERWERREADVPAVALTDGWDGDRVAAAVSAGVTDTLPRALLDEDPGALARQVVSAADAGCSEQRNRSERLARRLREATEAVARAETEQAVCAAAVEAATSALDLPAPACWTTSGDGRLRPVAGAASAWRPPEADPPSTFGPGDPAYDAYEEGEVTTAGRDDGVGPESVGGGLFVPLGDHGVLGVGHASDDSPAGATRDALRVLTRHVATALDRVAHRRELESTYRGIFESVSDGLVIHHPETGEVLDANRRFCEMNGYDREELIGETIDVVTGPDHDYETARERIQAAREEGPQLFELRNRTKDGATFPVEVHLSVVEIRGEERVLGSVRDISERRSTERRLSEVLDRIDEAVYITPAENLGTADRGPDYLSAGYEEIWGWPLDALRERYENGFFDTLHPDDRADYRAFVERITDEVAAGTAADSYDTEYRIERPDGGVRWVRSEYYPIEWDAGPTRIVTVSRDVTERKRTRRNLRTIAERVDEAIYMSSPDKREVYYASPSFEELWDLPIERVYEDPQAFIDRIHPDDLEWFREEYDRIRADLTDPEREPQDTYELEYRVRHPGGEVRWIDVRGYPVFDSAGNVDRWIAVNRDVTDRKARERRIASFDDATENLVTADSPEEAADTAVTAARDVLELPAIGAYLYDDDAGVLRSEAVAGPVPDGVGSEPVGPGDGPLWEAFATGTVAAPDAEGPDDGGDDGNPGPFTALAGWRAIPLGSHGVLAVGSPDGSLGSERVQTAHVLAATLEAALAHLRGRRQLADRERELRTQTERADRLDRIARLTSRVEAAITDATAPGEVERAVCDRLTNSGSYDLAWIGGVDVGSDRVTCRAVAGGSAEHVDAMRLTTADDTADRHPAVAAWRSGEVRAVNSLVGDGPAGEWRHHALSDGYQSLCAVPLTYDGVTHGVLTVGADTPNSFGDREQETLAQLGTSIANALAAIERRRALESDETVELEFNGPGDALPFARAAATAGCSVTLRRTVAGQDGPVSCYFAFEGDVPDDAAAVARRTLPGTVEVVDDDTDATLVEARTDEWFGTPLAEYGGTLREASADPEGTTVAVEVPGETDVRSFVERLRDIAPTLELVAKRQRGRQERTPAALGGTLTDTLTDRQLEVLRTAVSAGYFEWPREHDSNEVADRLDITQPTFNKHLRIAERETFDLLLGDDE